MKFSVLALAFLWIAHSAAWAGPAAPPHFSKVLYIVLENSNYTEASRQPFLRTLAGKGVTFTNFFAENHPSQGNYIAMVAGDTLGVNHDRTVNLSTDTIATLLERKGLSWKVYAEDYPGNCYLGSKRNYVRRHNPFISFTGVQKDASRCSRIVNASEFDADLKSDSLPTYSFYVPDLRNDGHDTNVSYADAWLERKLSPLLNHPALNDTLVIVTFDESEGRGPNKIYTSLYGRNVNPGTVLDGKFDHYSLLRLMEDEWSLGNLGRKDASAASLTGLWKAD